MRLKMSNLIIIVFIFVINSEFFISSDTAQLLWNVTNNGVTNRQNFNNLHYQQNFNHLPQYSPNSQYDLLQYQKLHQNLYIPPTRPNLGNSQLPFPFNQKFRLPTQSFMEALDSIAQNDKLRCVPRLLCELTSGRTPNNYRAFGLPFNINSESLLSLLGTINGPNMSPIMQFGKAALLGYASNGNSASCMYAYPDCPKDADRLVEYLNNYNGGFFRFFKGQPLKQHQEQHHNKYGFLQHPQFYQAQKRILTKPNFEYTHEIKFPTQENEIYSGIPYKSQRTFIFPQDDEYVFKKPKTFLNTNFATPVFLPDRTGTGELRLDLDELNINKNNYVKFLPDISNDEFYYKNHNGVKF